jgi:glycosyltransferase involved in cell wall biosynthesis
MLPISAYIITHNEADRIAITIRSLQGLVSEVLVVDSGSTDGTQALCESLGARVIHNAWPGYGFQKRFAENTCKNNWVLNLDSDEELTPAIIEEIRGLFASGVPAAPAYIFQIRDLLPGEKKLAAGAHTDFRVRLYDRRRAQVREALSIDPVDVHEGEAVTLQSPVLHRSFRSLAHAIEKMNGYTTVQAKVLAEGKGIRYPLVRLVIEFPVAFVKAYVLRGYALRGWRGFAFSVFYAFSRVMRVAKYLELTRN